MTKTTGNGCSVCQMRSIRENNRKQGLLRSGSLASEYPIIAGEWHPTKNSDKTPTDISPHSGVPVWWLCKRGHEWKVPPNQRTRGQGTGCPKCNPQISKLEIALYCELKAIFKEVQLGIKVSNLNCDILIKPLRLIIELDGYPWHHGHENRDKKKNEKLEQLGYTVLRVRDKRLKPISAVDVTYDGRNLPLVLTKAVLRRLIENGFAPVSFAPDIKRYLGCSKLNNEDEYYRLISILPGPPYEDSLGYQYPSLVPEWHTKRNHPMVPSMFRRASNQEVWWICGNGHEYKAIISVRTLRGQGCPICSGVSRGLTYKKLAVKQSGSLVERYPTLASEWHPTKNGTLTPQDRSSGSQDKVWWLCKNGHEWKAIINSRIRGNGCRQCYLMRKRKKPDHL